MKILKSLTLILAIFLTCSTVSFGQSGPARQNANPENIPVYLSKRQIAKFVGKDYVNGKKSKDYKANPAHLTKEELVGIIDKYIKNKSNVNNGYFPVYDNIVNHQLDLSIIKVHGDCLKYLGDSLYFDCGYFNGKDDGNRYDVDIFMKWDGNKFNETKTIVHKVNYQSRYDWADEGNTFKAVPVPDKSIHKGSASSQSKKP